MFLAWITRQKKHKLKKQGENQFNQQKTMKQMHSGKCESTKMTQKTSRKLLEL